MTKLTRSLAQEGWQEQPDSQEALGTQDDEDDEGGLPGGVPDTRNSDLRRGVEGGLHGGLPGGVHDIAMPRNPCRSSGGVVGTALLAQAAHDARDAGVM